MMTPDEIIAVVTAFKQGKLIEQSLIGGSDVRWEWFSANEPGWNFAAFRYRVKKEPREFWINVYENQLCAHASTAAADKSSSGDRIECIHVREVL